MYKRAKTLLFAGLGVLVVAIVFAGFTWITRPKPTNIDLAAPAAIEARYTVERMYLLEESISCVPGTTIDVLAEVMVDSSDYHSTSFDRDKIVKVYGKQALTHAGLLTSKQAYYFIT